MNARHLVWSRHTCTFEAINSNVLWKNTDFHPPKVTGDKQFHLPLPRVQTTSPGLLGAAGRKAPEEASLQGQGDREGVASCLLRSP